MKIQDVVIPILWLAITTTVNCNLEGDVLHAQRSVWTDPNNVLQSWDPTLVNPCTWFHVTCNNDNSVIRVDLGNAGISGPLLPQLGILANLEYLELYENNLTGAIPSSFGNLSKLVSLDLYHNGLNGSIPSSLGNIKTLKFLRLNGNFLIGMVPTNVLNLVLTGSLIELDVSKNWLHGTRKTRSKSQLRESYCTGCYKPSPRYRCCSSASRPIRLDVEGRYEILRIHTRKMKLGAGVDLREIARSTELFTGADLEGLCRKAGMAALREDISTDSVLDRHFRVARDSLRPSLTRSDIEEYSFTNLSC